MRLFDEEGRCCKVKLFSVDGAPRPGGPACGVPCCRYENCSCYFPGSFKHVSVLIRIEVNDEPVQPNYYYYGYEGTGAGGLFLFPKCHPDDNITITTDRCTKTTSCVG